MTYTFHYSGNVTFNASGDTITVQTVTPPQAHQLSQLAFTLGAHPGTGTQQNRAGLNQIGGSTNAGAGLCVAVTSGISGTGVCATPIAADATGYSLNLFAQYVVSPPFTTTYTIDVTFTDAIAPVCAYGAEPNPSAAIYTYITDALVEAVAAALGMGPLGLIALGVMIGSPIVFPVCNNVPTEPPPLTDADFIDGTPLPNPLSMGKWMQHFTYGVWLFYCQCKAAPTGSPAPVNPPVPTPPTRLAPGPQPTSPCTDTDVCQTLTRIVNTLTTINVSIQNNSYVQAEPAYTWGTLYSNITGNGEIPVSGILGVFVSYATLPNRVGTEIGDPNYLFDIGFITFGTADAWMQRQTITANPWITLPLHMQNVSRVGYSIPPDITCSIRLLVPVPMALAAAGGT